MPIPTSEDEVTMSICMGRGLRLALEQVKLQRGHRQHRMPSLRSLIEEAIQALVEREAACTDSGVANPDTNSSCGTASSKPGGRRCSTSSGRG